VTLREPQGQPEHGRGLIDLHLHTTASDGRCSPSELVDVAARAGVTVMAATDHDTTGGLDEVRSRASERGIDVVTGIEITAVEKGLDVHVLGYFFEPADATLQAFLVAQRASRIVRIEAIGKRLVTLGYPVDVAAIVADARQAGARAIGRPQIARAMVAAGYVADVQEAFTRWLGSGCPAFVPRVGPSIESVIQTIHDARGLASLAHPGRTRIDDRIDALHEAGLDAVEAFHSDHGPEESDRYLQRALRVGLLVTGGSDFHGDPARALTPGSTSLPHAHWTILSEARCRYA